MHAYNIHVLGNYTGQKWYGVAYEQKKWYGKCHTSHTASAAIALYAYLQDSVPNTYTLEQSTNPRAEATLNKGQSKMHSATNDDTDNYKLDGSVDENYCKPGETIDDEYDYADEKEFWEPASQEKELKMQVEKLTEIPVIKRDSLQ